MSESWWEFVQRVSVGASNKDIAERTGLHASAISRWNRHGEQPTAQSVIAFARAYDRPAIEALIAAGYLTDQDLVIMGAVPLVRSISDVPNIELVAEMTRRMETNDPRRIAPGSADDEFPQWSSGDKRSRRKV